ncbi:MAG TPA: UDP-N-acetylmuramoyl-L-alanyl-D-glutamate--2,6-diaminopimelate ligase [Pirellulales bacterium]|nr:UDP-N-acetylmuramoyl-L-alanyl-D-glutamate--2,6-diaminopimelate ligase [Pirellulales bacterium]
MRERIAQVPGISLRQVLPDAEFIGADDIAATSCSADSRTCRRGDLFVALPASIGPANNGNLQHFAREAISRGAAALLTDRPVPSCKLPTCYVADVREAYGHVCQALAGYPGRRLKAIGITGTNGKTTTGFLTAAILSTAGFQPGLLGTLGYCDAVTTAEARWTTPPAPVLAHWLARMAANGCSHAVMEVSSHALDQSRVAGVDFDVACVTNVRRDHLDYHGTEHHYRAAKLKLLNHLLPEGFAIVNADDPVAAGFLSQCDGPVLTIGLDTPAEVTAVPLEQCASEQTFLLHAGDETVPVRTPLVGEHNIRNCLAAAAIGTVYGIDLPTIVRGLESVACVPGRLERIECGQSYHVFVDFAHTPDALTEVLATLRRITEGRLICVFGAGGDRDKTKRPMMGRTVEEAADLAVVTSDNPRSEPPRSIIAEILAGFRRPIEARVIPNRAEAIAWALDHAQPGDTVLIAGKGHEQTQIIGHEHVAFDDREVAKQWLYESTPYPMPYLASA